MSVERKTQLSLLLLAALMTIGLTSYLVKSVRTQFAIHQSKPASGNVVAAAQSSAGALREDKGTVLGASDNPQANPLQGIYVNPFPGQPSGISTTSNGGAAAVIMTASDMQPTAPIKTYMLGYTYPIAELHNCVSQQACLDFCDQLTHVPLCATFSVKQGYMKPDMIDVATRMAVGLLSSRDFAACGTASKCVALCDDQTNASTCAKLVSDYQLSSRVLGASTGTDVSNSNAAPLYDVSLANPYSHFVGDYSDPSLQGYINSHAAAGCAPFDMVCLDNQAPAGRVLNVIAPNEDNGGGGGTDLSYPDSPTDSMGLSQCIDGSSQGIYDSDPVLVTPQQQEAAKRGAADCTAAYAQNRSAILDSKKQETFGDINQFQACIKGTTNISADISRCIDQYLR
jgi:hypothetical protein